MNAIVLSDKTLKQITTFCTAFYEAALSPDAAAKKLKNLRLTDALALWQAEAAKTTLA